MWLGPQPASPPALHAAGKCWKTLSARDSVSPLGTDTRKSADAFNAPIRPDAEKPRAESLWKYECPGFIFITEPLFYAGTTSSPCRSPLQAGADALFHQKIFRLLMFEATSLQRMTLRKWEGNTAAYRPAFQHPRSPSSSPCTGAPRIRGTIRITGAPSPAPNLFEWLSTFASKRDPASYTLNFTFSHRPM